MENRDFTGIYYVSFFLLFDFFTAPTPAYKISARAAQFPCGLQRYLLIADSVQYPVLAFSLQPDHAGINAVLFEQLIRLPLFGDRAVG